MIKTYFFGQCYPTLLRFSLSLFSPRYSRKASCQLLIALLLLLLFLPLQDASPPANDADANGGGHCGLRRQTLRATASPSPISSTEPRPYPGAGTGTGAGSSPGASTGSSPGAAAAQIADNPCPVAPTRADTAAALGHGHLDIVTE